MENLPIKCSSLRAPKAFISCLPDSISKDDLREYLSLLPNRTPLIDFQTKKDAVDVEITNVVLTFAREQDRNSFIEQPHMVQGQKLKISRYMEEDELKEHLEDIRSRQVYIKKLPVAVSDRELGRLFEPYGRIRKAYSFKGKRYKKRRRNFKYGYVIFEDPGALNLVPDDGIFYKGKRIKWTCYRMKVKKRMMKEKNAIGEEHLVRPVKSQYHQSDRSRFCNGGELFLNLQGERFPFTSDKNYAL